MVINVDFQAGAVDDFSEFADAAGLAGVYQYQPNHGLQVNVFDPDNIVHVDHGFDEEVPQVPLLGAGEDDKGFRVKLFGCEHAGECIKIRIDVGGDNREAFG
jgi:hypothetical protein